MSYELYSLLGVSPDSSVEEIKAAYSELLREHYSKKYPSEKEKIVGEERFKKITSAYHMVLNSRANSIALGSAIPSNKKEMSRSIEKGKNLEKASGKAVNHEEGKPTALEYFEIGKNSFNKGNYKDAVMHFKNAIRFYPDDGRFYNYLGLAYAKQNLFKMAITSCEKALSLSQRDQNLAIFQRDYGLILEESGDLIKAKTHFAEALKLDSGDRISSQHLEDVTKEWKIVTKQKVSVHLYITTGIALVFFLIFIYYSS